MRKHFLFLLGIIASVAMSSCSKFDEIWSKLDEYETRISKLEANQESMGKIVNAMKSWDYITGISSIEEKGVIIGYKLIFSKLGEITIFNGTDGQDGDSMFKDVFYDDAFVTLILADDSVIRIERFQGIQLWEDGPYWAPFNIGSTKPEESGLYFSWGNVTGYSHIDGVFSHLFTDDETYEQEPGSKLEDDIPANASYDAAKASWGGKWRMPACDELKLLVNQDGANKTDGGKWVEDYNGTGVNGILVTGLGEYSDKSVFFPAAGFADFLTLKCENVNGYYWSSTCGNLGFAVSLGLDDDSADVDFDFRTFGFVIRPVYGESGL